MKICKFNKFKTKQDGAASESSSSREGPSAFWIFGIGAWTFRECYTSVIFANDTMTARILKIGIFRKAD